MKTTTNPDEATPEDDGTDDTVDDNSNEDISYGENGNPVDEGVIGGADNEAAWQATVQTATPQTA